VLTFHKQHKITRNKSNNKLKNKTNKPLKGAMILGHVQSAELKIRENSVLTVGQPSQLQMSNQSYK
ncbi:hypothetical protein XU19_23725, partial [Vibrio parahaemolyticus]